MAAAGGRCTGNRHVPGRSALARCCYECFHGDNGAGLGVSHQTGWTGLVARALDLFGRVDAKDLELEMSQVSARLVEKQVGGRLTPA